MHSERPKLYTILAFLSAVGLNVSPVSGKAHIAGGLPKSMHTEALSCKYSFISENTGFLMFGLSVNPIALRKAKIVYNFGLSECSRVKCITSLRKG